MKPGPKFKPNRFLKTKNGDIRLFLTKGKSCLVSFEDYDLVKKYRWYSVARKHTNYAETVKNGVHIRMPRLILQAPAGILVDHINHDGLDNRRENIRLCTLSQNQFNKKKQFTRTSCKFKGVSFCKIKNKWRGGIKINYKQIDLGYFNSAKEAAKAYDRKAKELFGDFAHFNFKSTPSAKGELTKTYYVNDKGRKIAQYSWRKK